MWKQEITALREQYFQLRDEILAKHASLVEQVLAEYAIVAADTYQRIWDTSPEALSESQVEFVASYCQRIESLIPDPEHIRATFDFTFTLKDGVKELDDDAEKELPASTSVSLEQLRIQAGNRTFEQSVMERDLLTQEREQKKTMIEFVPLRSCRAAALPHLRGRHRCAHDATKAHGREILTP